MANEHIINNNLEVTGSIKSTVGFYGDGSNLTGITSVAEWDGSRNGDASITGSLVVSGSNVVVDFQNISELVASNVSGSFSGSYQGNGSGLTNLNLNGYQASGSTLSGSFSGSFEGDGSGLTGLATFPHSGNAIITGSLTITGSSVVADFTNTVAISGSIFSGSFVGDGSGLTNVPASEWDGSRNGDAEITGSFIVSGSSPTIELLGDTTIDQNIEISNRDQFDDIAIGYQALPDTTFSGINGATRRAIAIGYQAATNLTSGSQNIYIGQCAGYSNVKSINNIGIGFCALACYTGLDWGGDFNLGNNIAIGANALKVSDVSVNNLAIGTNSSCNIGIGGNNTTVGHITGCNISSGRRNTILGDNSGKGITTENDNTYIGAQAGSYSRGSYNTAVGRSALGNGPASSNIPTGDCNVAVGIQAGVCVVGNSNKNVYLGPYAGPSTGLVQNCQLYIGIDKGETPLIRGDFGTGQLTINSQVSASLFSGSFVGDGSGLTGVAGAGFPYQGDAEITGSLIVSQSTAAGTAVTIENGHTILSQVSESLNFDNDTEAAAGGVPLGGLYRSGNFIAIRLT